MKTHGIYSDSHGTILAVDGLKLEDMNKILACELRESGVRPASLLFNILFKGVYLDESKNKERLEKDWGRNTWGYYHQFMENMDRIHEMITNKFMISLADLHLVLFSEKTLQEMCAKNGYFVNMSRD